MKDKTKRVVRKYYEYLMTKIELLWRQKKYTNDGTGVKYILKKHSDAEVLTVVLSSCTRRGIKARYNYMKTLKNVPCHQLFVLDDYAEDRRGSYYLGENLKFNEEKTVHMLIQKTIRETNAKRVVFCGSSKGGYAALNFGLEYDDAFIIAGGPQYFLGDYLIGSSNVEAFRHTIGNSDEEEGKQLLNRRLKNKVLNQNGKGNQNIYLHYSDKEHTYEEHIKYLLQDLSERGYKVYTDVADYTNHSDIAYYFPDFLKAKLAEILNLQ